MDKALALAGCTPTGDTLAGAVGLLQALPEGLVRLPQEELTGLFAALMRVRALAEGAALATFAEARRRSVVAESDHAGDAAWVTNEARAAGAPVTRGLASAFAAVAAEADAPGSAALVQAAVAGRVSVTEANPILREFKGMRHELPGDLWEVAATELVDWCAQGAGLGDIAAAREAIVAQYGLPGAFEDKIAAQQAVRSFGSFRRDRAGLHVATVRLDGESVAVVEAALSGLAAPRPLTDGQTPQARDDRDRAMRRADALVEMCAHVGTDPTALPDSRPTSAARSQLVLTMPLADYQAGRGYARAENDQPVPAPLVRELACDADLTAVLLGHRDDVLYVGRRHRYATARQLIALRVRDKGCSFPGCDRPPSWSDAHHIAEWARDDGPTDLTNLTLLCRRHHAIVHQRGYTATITAADVTWHLRDRPRGTKEGPHTAASTATSPLPAQPAATADPGGAVPTPNPADARRTPADAVRTPRDPVATEAHARRERLRQLPRAPNHPTWRERTEHEAHATLTLPDLDGRDNGPGP